jgi:IclR family acetate operon transcriptional repressor
MPNIERDSKYPVKSVGRALELLEVLAVAGENGLSLTELAAGVGMAKSSTMAAAQTLAHFGFLHIEQPGPRYHLGFALLRFGDLVSQQTSLSKVALPILHELSEQTGLTARFAVNDAGFPVFIDRVDGRGVVRFHATLGQRESPHATGAGKAILAQLDSTTVTAVIDEWGLPRHTASTITSRDDFLVELERVRLVGFGVDNEEESEGIVCVGAPIFDHHRQCVAAISLTGLKADLAEGDVGRLGGLVREYADRITKILSGERG